MIDIDVLRAMVKNWRGVARYTQHLRRDVTATYEECADTLEIALDRAADAQAPKKGKGR